MKQSIIIATSSSELNKLIFNLLHPTKLYDIVEVSTEGKYIEHCLFKNKPHIAILCECYKQANGISITRRLNKAGINTKVALITSNKDITMMRLALEFGAMAYFDYSHAGQIIECLSALKQNEHYIETELYHKHYFAKTG